jgi:hypothetical protein
MEAPTAAAAGSVDGPIGRRRRGFDESRIFI